MKKYLIGVGLAALLIVLAIGQFIYRHYRETRYTYPENQEIDISQATPDDSAKDNLSDAQPPNSNIAQGPPQGETTSQSIQKPTPQPSKILLDVPFTTQAPFANWDEVHEETCEEAAVLMAIYALDGQELNPQLAEDELLKLVAWQKDQFGYFEDTNASKTAQIVTDYYHKKAEIIYDFTVDDIKQSLIGKKPVVILAAGRLLGNPFYKQPGPIYHALVIRGFDGDTLITNDPGTRRGERFTYKSSVVINASHEWVGDPERILEGRRAMIVISD